MKELILETLEQSMNVKQAFFNTHTDTIQSCALAMADALKNEDPAVRQRRQRRRLPAYCR